MLRLSLTMMMVTWVVAVVRLSLAMRNATQAPVALETPSMPERLAA